MTDFVCDCGARLVDVECHECGMWYVSPSKSKPKQYRPENNFRVKLREFQGLVDKPIPESVLEMSKGYSDPVRLHHLLSQNKGHGSKYLSLVNRILRLNGEPVPVLDTDTETLVRRRFSEFVKGFHSLGTNRRNVPRYQFVLKKIFESISRPDLAARCIPITGTRSLSELEKIWANVTGGLYGEGANTEGT